mmetsp:Transcript_24778/g.46596  ORF Transcript_24778/g.46596 Transcript_24778/m.46596 type:complete len:504 (-) Transcript_24778:32-1543(-)
MKLLLTVAQIFLLGLPLAAGKANTDIEHVVVLMLENRAFDHMLGYLTNINSDITGCTPESCSNPIDPTDPGSPLVNLTYDAVYQQSDPCHSISCTTEQVFGYDDSGDATASMTGFIKSYADRTGNITYAPKIMESFHPSHVPAIYNISQEFAIFDAWHASVPGPTMVNRAYAASATSHGMGTNNPKMEGFGLPQKTMFEQLLDMGLDFRVYFQQFPSVLQHKPMRKPKILPKYHLLDKLFDDLERGDMPEFSWVEPGYFDGVIAGKHVLQATDQHPDHDVSAGDDLIRRIYNAVRASPLWEKTALVITYDEHGGFFDHVPPPSAPNPDGLNSTDDPFDFTRLGVRIPTIIASPLIPKGTVVKSPESGGYEHSSIVSTVVHKLFSAEKGYEEPTFLTKRDEWAATFESVFSLSEPRKDCPTEAPEVVSHRDQFPHVLPKLDGKMPITHLQQEIIDIASMLETEICQSDTEVLLGDKEMKEEGEALEWILNRVESCLGIKVIELE